MPNMDKNLYSLIKENLSFVDDYTPIKRYYDNNSIFIEEDEGIDIELVKYDITQFIDFISDNFESTIYMKGYIIKNYIFWKSKKKFYKEYKLKDFYEVNDKTFLRSIAIVFRKRVPKYISDIMDEIIRG